METLEDGEPFFAGCVRLGGETIVEEFVNASIGMWDQTEEATWRSLGMEGEFSRQQRKKAKIKMTKREERMRKDNTPSRTSYISYTRATEHPDQFARRATIVTYWHNIA